MSEVQTPETPAAAIATPEAPVVAPTTPVAAAPAAPVIPLTAIQLIQQEMMGFFKQREQAIANVHAIDGAIQSSQRLLTLLQAEEQKGLLLAKTTADRIAAEATKVVDEVAKVL